MTEQEEFEPGEIWVVKVGSSLLTGNGSGLAVDLVAHLVDEISELARNGIRTVLVSSGAVAEGMTRLGLSKRPDSLHLLQAAAAVGQMGLVQVYETNFKRHGMHTAQILLTHDDLRSRKRYLNARATLRSLLDLGVVPVINENDTVVTDEIRFGDNDTLAGMVANLIEANLLVLLTDQQGLYTCDPARSEAELVPVASASDDRLDAMAGPGSALGRGGMVTKISAARIAARSGANTVITSGSDSKVLSQLAAGRVAGTRLMADRGLLVSRKQWLAGLPARGVVHLDAGAVRVLQQDGKSLLPVGVKKIEGVFTRGEMVACVGPDGVEVARGLINYSDTDAVQIIGRSSTEIESILGFVGEVEMIHRDNLVLSR